MVQISYTIADPTSMTVSCSPGTFVPGGATVCIATVTDTAVSGQSTPTGTVTLTSGATGTFAPSTCTLTGTTASASCPVFFTSLPTGTQQITATYNGDNGHRPSTGTTQITVAVPASTNGCLVLDTGHVTLANGDTANLLGLTVASPHTASSSTQTTAPPPH